MKTKNVFTLTMTEVKMEIFDVTNPDAPKLLEEKAFDVTAIPAELENGDNPQTLAAYGLSRLLQDRNSGVTDKSLAEYCTTSAELAKARMEAYQATYDVLASGMFKARRATSGNAGAAVDSFFAKGFARWLQEQGKDVTEDGAALLLQGMDKEKRKAIRAHDGVKAKIDEVRKAARDSLEGIDLDGLF